MTWDSLFLGMAAWMAKKSKDPSTQTGCIVVGSDHRIRSAGYNGFPVGVQDLPERYEDRALKYKMIEHCDRNAIYSAAKIGVSLDGCIMYLTGPPCSECMRGIIQAGISEVVWPVDNKFEKDPATFERWRESFELMSLLASEAGIKMRRA